MNALHVARALGPVDARSVLRDSLLRWTLVFPLLLALSIRLLLPSIARRVGAGIGVDLMAYYDPILGCALLLSTPVMVGMVVGFLLLDQRDDRTLVALRVTPMSPGSFLLYRLSTPLAISVALTLAAFPLAGLRGPGYGALALAATLAALLAPLLALALAVFAANKVQGFALVKAGGVLLIAPLVAYFVPLPWQLVFGLAPTFWPSMLYWSLADGSGAWRTLLLVGLAYHVLLLAFLLRRFERVVVD